MDHEVITIQPGRQIEELFQNGLGEEVHPFNAIFPIFEIVSESEWKSSGTGFFVLPESGIFATAKHNLVNKDERVIEHLVGIQCTRIGSEFNYYPRLIQNIRLHPVADVALGALTQSLYKNHQVPETNEAFLISSSQPVEQDRIATYAIPKPRVFLNQNGRIELEFAPRLMYGEIQRHLPDGRDRSLQGNCFETSMGFEGGASGGPVFCSNEMVFAVNSQGRSYFDSWISRVGGPELGRWESKRLIAIASARKVP